MRADFGSVEELRTFLRIVEAGSLSAAAEEERLSVNAVSQRLQKLEGRLGVRLLSRTTRRVRPTDEGLRFAERCRRALGELDEGAFELQRDDRGLAGRVTLVLHATLAQPSVLGALSATLATHPALRLELRMSPTLEGLPPFDLAMWIKDVPLRSLIMRRVGKLAWALGAAPSYVKAHGAPRTLDELREHEFLRALTSPPESQLVFENKRGRKATARVGGRFEANDTEALRLAMFAGVGIGLRPLEEVLRGVREGTLSHVLPGWGLESLPLYLLSPPGRLKVARVRIVSDTLALAARELG